ncbi:MAG: ABC-2 family transporter protein [Candidatus Paceibacterota bacterium]|jgi:ABC-2 type transport system permease protein
MREIRLAKKIILTLVKDRIQYTGRLIADSLSIFARCGILLILYWYVFRLNNGLVNGVTYITVAWSMFFYFTFSVLNLRNISREIMKDVQSGSVETLLSKPVSYFWYKIWWQIGSGLYPFLVIIIVGAIAMFSIVGIPDTMTLGIFLPTLFLVFIGAMILSLILYSIVGFMAFWIEDINPIFWMVDKMVMILGGSYLPVALFPSFMYKIALYSPFGASQFITHTVYDSWKTNWYILLLIQLFWIIVLGIVAYVIFLKARKRISVNGG